MSGADSTLDLACQLIARCSVTPDDAGCQELIATRLKAAGFAVESLPFGGVSNLWATRGTGAPLIVLAGHTDVVPPGPSEQWSFPPFVPTLREGVLYGRGAADMKGSVAAMVTALERFAGARSEHDGTVALLLTSDEEGPARDGTRRVIETLAQRRVQIDYCVVGEPTSGERLGDTLRNGRRGSLTGHLTVRGIQGHVAYPAQADNPIHRALPALTALAEREWDRGNAHFPPTTLQIAAIEAGTGADNVIPGELRVTFNFRFSTEQTATGLQDAVARLLDAHGLNYEITWRHGADPYLTSEGTLVNAACEAVHEVVGQTPSLSTGGGTSDGRFIAPTGAQVVELGPVNATIHQIDERVAAADLSALSAIYEALLNRLIPNADGTE